MAGLRNTPACLPPARQTISNQGTLSFERVDLVAAPWRDEAGGGSLVGVDAPATEVSVDGVAYGALAEGTAVARGLEGGAEAPLWFRVSLPSGLQGGTLVQNVTYQAMCMGP